MTFVGRYATSANIRIVGDGDFLSILTQAHAMLGIQKGSN